jgi:hypothetical protein
MTLVVLPTTTTLLLLLSLLLLVHLQPTDVAVDAFTSSPSSSLRSGTFSIPTSTSKSTSTSSSLNRKTQLYGSISSVVVPAIISSFSSSGLSSSSAMIISDTATTTTAGEAVADVVEVISNDQNSIVYGLDQNIVLFDDPLIRSIFIAFGGVIILLSVLSVLSKNVDAVIQNVADVADDYVRVLKSNPEFEVTWNDIQKQLIDLSDNSSSDDNYKRAKTAKIIEIMEEMEKSEPELMNQISIKMEKLK